MDWSRLDSNSVLLLCSCQHPEETWLNIFILLIWVAFDYYRALTAIKLKEQLNNCSCIQTLICWGSRGQNDWGEKKENNFCSNKQYKNGTRINSAIMWLHKRVLVLVILHKAAARALRLFCPGFRPSGNIGCWVCMQPERRAAGTTQGWKKKKVLCTFLGGLKNHLLLFS